MAVGLPEDFKVFVYGFDDFLGPLLDHSGSGHRVSIHHPKREGHIKVAHTKSRHNSALVYCDGVEAVGAFPNILVLHRRFVLYRHFVYYAARAGPFSVDKALLSKVVKNLDGGFLKQALHCNYSSSGCFGFILIILSYLSI